MTDNWENGAYHASPRTTRDWVPYHPEDFEEDPVVTPRLRAGLAMAWVALAAMAMLGIIWVSNWGAT